MKTSELLAHIGGPILDDRAVLVAGASDQLFPDSTIIRYLNEAEKLLCQFAWVLEDKITPASCVIQLLNNVNEYQFHKSIIHIKAAKLSDSDVDLTRVG